MNTATKHDQSKKEERNQNEENMKDKTEQATKNAAEQAREAGENVAEKAKEGARYAQNKADDATKHAGDKTQQGADYMKEKGPKDGIMGKAVQSVADGIDRTGEYLSEQGVSGMAEDLTKVIKKHPVPAMLVGVGVGFLVGQLMTRR